MTERRASTSRVALPEIRELLFADVRPGRMLEILTSVPDDRLPTAGSLNAALLAGATAAARDDLDDATAQLGPILDAKPETRIRLQVWSLLRAAGFVFPKATSATARGVVVEMGFAAGVETLGAYEDGTARYLNQGGGAVFWDAPETDAEIGAAIRRLIETGQAVADHTEPLDGPRPRSPDDGFAAICVLTDAGVHVGTGPAAALGEDPIGGPVLSAALAVIQLLVARSEAGPKAPGNAVADVPSTPDASG